MKNILAISTLILLSSLARSESNIRIEAGHDYQKYSHSDLQRRVWNLERAVAQLQDRIAQLENGNSSTSGGSTTATGTATSATSTASSPTVNGDTWVCTISAMGNAYTGTGASKAVATSHVIEACKAARGGDGFFCKDPKCEQ